MEGLRARLTVVALVASMFAGAFGANVFAAGRQQVCAMPQHHCGDAAQIASCDCCGHDQSTGQTGTPAESKIELLRMGNAPAALAIFVNPVTITFATACELASGPPARLLDRPVVFGALLI